jgi:hypothetical protein
MRAFHTGFAKALGAAVATSLVSLLGWLVCVWFGVIPRDSKQAETLLIFLLVGPSLWLSTIVCFRYWSNRKLRVRNAQLEKQLSRAKLVIDMQELIYGKKKDDT